MMPEQLEKFEFDGLMQDVHQREKGSKSCKDPHTAFTILTRKITNQEMDKIVYGGVYGFKVKLIIEVVKEPQTNVTTSISDSPNDSSRKVVAIGSNSMLNDEGENP